MARPNPRSDAEAWGIVDADHLWIFDKLIVAKKAGHKCGPRGVDVPLPGKYIIRPIWNIEGMGVGAYCEYLDSSTLSIPDGFFWCEFFEGEHLSVDYCGFEPVLSVRGTKDTDKPLQRFTHWEKVNHFIPLPQMLVNICLLYKSINCEFIGGKLIEIHVRSNPDFRYSNTIMIPVWPNQPVEPPAGFRFIQDIDEPERIGIFVN